MSDETTERKSAQPDDAAVQEDNPSALPAWVDMPSDLRPPPGVQMMYLRFLPKWTTTPDKGERQCIMWPLTDNDERVALVRCRDNPANAVNELAKQTIRVVDGVRVDWGAKHGQPGNIEDFWREIGPKCRNVVTRFYNRTHSMDAAETAYFLEHCVAVRTAS